MIHSMTSPIALDSFILQDGKSCEKEYRSYSVPITDNRKIRFRERCTKDCREKSFNEEAHSPSINNIELR